MLHPQTRAALLLGLAAAAAALATDPALAQAPPAPATGLSWASLDPGTDTAAQLIRSIFPVPGFAAAPSPGQATTVVTQVVGQFTGMVAAIAAAFVCYQTIMNIHRAAESSRILGSGQSWIFVVRVGFAAVMMFPLGGGFSAGQALVMQAAQTGIGMGRAVYLNAVRAVGPDAVTIAEPMIPGTQQVVAGLIDSEMCGGLLNLASNTADRPEPLVRVYQRVTPGRPAAGGRAAEGGQVTYAYGLSPGNAAGNPACGSVVVRTSPGNAQVIGGVSVDMADTQRLVLDNVLLGTIRPRVGQVTQQFWATRRASDLAPLADVLRDAVEIYTEALRARGAAVTQQIRSNVQANAAALRAGDDGLLAGQVQQSQIGWAGAGAYYLQIASLNAATLSLLSSVPVTTAPTYDGVSVALMRDVAPFQAAQRAFMNQMQVAAQTADGTLRPSGAPQTLASAAGTDGAVVVERTLASLNLTAGFAATVAGMMLPQGGMWSDPFGGLMSLGQTLSLISLSAFGAAGLLTSPTASGASVLWTFVTGNWGASAAIAAGSMLMQFLATPIFLLLTAILVPGLTIAYVLPVVPWVMWMAGVIGWIVLVCEAMIAVPLWMLAHMTFAGEGLHGRAREGWGLLFNVAFRPVLMVIGLFLSYAVFAAASWLIRMTFGTAMGFAVANGWFVTNVIGTVILLWVFVGLHVAAVTASFRMIAQLPHHLPRHLGFAGAGRVDMDDLAERAAHHPGREVGGGARDSLVGATRQLKEMGADRRKRLQAVAGPGHTARGPGAAANGAPPQGRGTGAMDTTLAAVSDSRGAEGRDAG